MKRIIIEIILVSVFIIVGIQANGACRDTSPSGRYSLDFKGVVEVTSKK